MRSGFRRTSLLSVTITPDPPARRPGHDRGGDYRCGHARGSHVVTIGDIVPRSPIDRLRRGDLSNKELRTEFDAELVAAVSA